ncbi:MAG TPA: hypothetical protein VEZ16_15395 [Microvirga sp.]|nr:hypothetical protein [Microvirga sp.]
MVIWAAIIALVLSGLAIVNSDPSSILMSLAELGAVVALFTLVCATESLSQR